jgi:hypothetical protein
VRFPGESGGPQLLQALPCAFVAAPQDVAGAGLAKRNVLHPQRHLMPQRAAAAQDVVRATDTGIP